MEFKPIYYSKKDHGDKGLDIINPNGSVGIVTLWNHPVDYSNMLKDRHPELFGPGSQLVTITSLYGNGLPQMLANLLYNPQISKIAVTGAESKISPSYKYLTTFLAGKVTPEDFGGMSMNRIDGTNFYLDAQLKPEMFRHLEVKRFETSDLEGITDYITSSSNRNVSESDRIRIDLVEPKFTTFPSDLSGHDIVARTPLEAWRKVLLCIDRYGHDFHLKKGRRRGLFNLDVSIKDPSFENEALLKKWNFDPDTMREYQQEILAKNLPEGKKYTYGNRLREYFGGDAVKKAGDLLKDDTLNRHALISLWDSKRDLLERKSSPCFTDAYFLYDVNDDSLMMTAHFRTHNAASAWLLNLYGLRAVQKMVAEYAGMKPGKINIRSRWIGIDPMTSDIVKTLEKIKSETKIQPDINDPKGYYTIDIDRDRLRVQHFAPNNVLLEEIYGYNEQEVRDQMRQLDGFSSTDHAMWFGVELQRITQQLEDIKKSG